MMPVHHIVRGSSPPPLVFVHGFACGHSDWTAQVEHFSTAHQVIAIDLHAHGQSPAPAKCSIRGLGESVAELVRTLDLEGAVLVGHSMGCRIVTDAAVRAADRVSAAIFVDGSQFAPTMAPVLTEACATPDGYASLTDRWFREMFTSRSDPATIAAVVERAGRLPCDVGRQLLQDMVRYDTQVFETQMSQLKVPVLAIQSTYSDERRERRTMRRGQTTPFLETLRTRLPSLRIEVIEDTGHFPQIDQPARTNEAIERFLSELT